MKVKPNKETRIALRYLKNNFLYGRVVKNLYKQNFVYCNSLKTINKLYYNGFLPQFIDRSMNWIDTYEGLEFWSDWNTKMYCFMNKIIS